jgi:hypothetical protein
VPVHPSRRVANYVYYHKDLDPGRVQQPDGTRLSLIERKAAIQAKLKAQGRFLSNGKLRPRRKEPEINDVY